MKIVPAVSAVILMTLFFSSAFSQKSREKSETFKKAEKYFFEKKYSMAEILLQEELRSNPENALAYSFLGDIFLDKKEYDGALSLYKKALDLNPSDSSTLFHIGDAYYAKQMGDLAVEYYRKSMAADPRQKTAYYHIGLTFLYIFRDKRGVIENWETFLRVAPEDPQYEKIRRVLELLRDPNFEIPPAGSDISIDEALHLGGAVLQKGEVKTDDKSADYEGKKNINKSEDIFRDDTLK